MPIEATPLFRPEIVRPRVDAFELPEQAATHRSRLSGWVDLLASPAGMERNETELLPDFLTDVFQRILGYTGPAEAEDGRYTISRERVVEVDGKFADAVLGDLSPQKDRFVVAVEGKGPKNPLDRPYGGRRMSAVDQGYRYAINLPCEWILVSNLREIRLYHKNSTQRQYERFELDDLVDDLDEFKRFVFVLGARRVVRSGGRSHLSDLLEASRQAGERLTQEFYRAYAGIRHDLLNALLSDNPTVEPSAVLSAAQRLLDRTLFVAFAEDRSLLPADSLAKAYEHRDPYNPRPVWDNFRALFRAIDEGNEALGVPRYNGGLFAEHALLDHELEVSDAACEHLKRLGDYNYGSPADGNGDGENGLVDVEILGHIFEQSIEDLEAIQVEIEGGEEASRTSSKRKREGAFYTPAYVTRYIVTEALRPVLEEKFAALRSTHRQRTKGTTAVSVLESPRVYEVDALNNPQRDALIAFWEEWIEALKSVHVVDPACGSGAFLIEVFDALHTEYDMAVGHLTELRRGAFAGSLFDPDRTILENNVYGVDLNEEAVEIARLSIWIKTAQRGKVLTDLDHNIQVGNSIVRDPEVDPRAFDWWSAFPEVSEAGGFDVVVGNPPYVRAEQLTSIKDYLQDNYETYHGAADLYVYFYELGVRLLRPGGQLSYVVTNKWLRTGYAEPLRAFFASQTWVDEIVDLGHAKQVFPDADVSPSILRVRKPTGSEPPEDMRACVIPREEFNENDLRSQVAARAFTISRESLSGAPWTLEPPALAGFMEKIRRAGPPLSDYLSNDPKYGVKTGYNKAFLLGSQEKEELAEKDPASAELLKPYLRGRDIKRWRPEWAELWMIVMRSSGDHQWPWSQEEDPEKAEGVFAAAYPGLHAHLKAHEDRLRARSDQGEFWWELRSCDYYDVFEHPKIVHTDITWRPEFAFADEPFYLVNTAYMWPTDDLYLLAVANSPLMWSYMWRHAQHAKDEALRMIYSFVTTLPIAEPSDEIRHAIEGRVRDLMRLERERQEATAHLLDWLRVEFGVSKAGQKLSKPVDLGADSFVSEVKKRRSGGSTVSGAELRQIRTEFDEVVRPMKNRVGEAESLEREISQLVCQAYSLTEGEIDLLWRTAPPRMPVGAPETTRSTGTVGAT